MSTMEPLVWLRKQLETADVDLLREMVSTFIAALMGAEADALCGPGPSTAPPYTYVWLDALTMRVREAGRIAQPSAVIATAVNADGHREILGLDLFTSEDGAGWTQFLRGLVARGFSGVRLVISDD